MTITSLRTANYAPSLRDPNMAALFSLVPGLGQHYNGQTRKAVLFLAVNFCNLMLFALMAFSELTTQLFTSIGSSLHIQPNQMLVQSIYESRLGSPVSLIYLGLVALFIAYAMRDAYDHAVFNKRRKIYAEYILEMTEATSSSYLFHFAIMFALFIMAFFFLIPPQVKPQITDIEFLEETQKPPKQVVQSRYKSITSHQASGKTNPHKPLESSHAKQANAKAQEITATKSAPEPAKLETKAPSVPVPFAPKPLLALLPQLNSLPMPKPVPAQSRTAQPLLNFMPQATSTTRVNPGPVPLIRQSSGAIAQTTPGPTPATNMGNSGSLHNFVPSAARTSGRTTSQGFSASGPGPMSTSQQNSPSGTLSEGGPIPSANSQGNRNGDTGNTGISPIRSTGHANAPGSGATLVLRPSTGRPGTTGTQSNPDRPGPGPLAGPALEASPDFGPFMADLQKRIKKAWFPPTGQESRRVQVAFKVSPDGQLQGLRIKRSSGVSQADQAALKAVQDAAPFRPLPKGANEDVDIEFTFDYNVFSSKSSGK